MRTSWKLLTILFAIFGASCSGNQHGPITNKGDALNLENLMKASWNKEQVILKLGQPKQVFDRDNSNDEMIVYVDPKTGYQQWSFTFSSSNLLTGITYIPSSHERNSYMKDSSYLKEHFKNCIDQKILRDQKDVIHTDTFLECESGVKIYYNQWNEVTLVSILK